MRRLAPLAAVAGLAALAGPAAADVRFEGRTSQGRLALLVAEDDGVPKRGVIRWHARCRRGGVTVPQGSVFRRPLDLSTSRRIRDAGSYRSRRYRGGVRLTIRVRLVGRKVGPRRWRGRFSAHAVVRQRGRVLDRCGVRGVRWRVVRVASR
jgi:hypothetical protein